MPVSHSEPFSLSDTSTLNSCFSLVGRGGVQSVVGVAVAPTLLDWLTYS